MATHFAVRRAWNRFRASLAVVSVAAVLMVGGPARADEAFRCELKESNGLSSSDAATATQLLCEQLRRASGDRGAFGITLAALGKIIIVTARREGTADAVTVQIDAIEEVPVAAVRIADALVHGQPFSATQRVDNLLPAETRPARAKKGSIKFALGVGDVEAPGLSARAAGFSLGLIYTTPRFALPAEVRFAWDDSGYYRPGVNVFSISVGGRSYLTKRDVSPFFGGGLGVLHIHGRDGEFPQPGRPATGYFEAERFGVAPYIEVGLEMLRLHRGRIAFQVRADFPTGALESVPADYYWYWDGRGGRPGASAYPAQSRYVVPITIGIGVAF